MKYRCFRCIKYETIIKTRYIRHLKRKNPCHKINDQKVGELLDEIQNKSYINRFENSKISNNYMKLNDLESQNPEKITENPEKITENPENPEKTKKYRCEYCQKSFTRKDNLKTHQKKHCKNKHKKVVLPIKNEDLSEQNYIKALENQIYQLCQEKDEYRKQMDKLITKTDKERKDLIDKVGVTNIQININNYGKENLEYLTNEYVGQLLKLPYNAVPQLLKHIHFNPKHPENHNIKIPNKKHKFALIRKGDKWEYRNKKNIIEDMVDTGYNILDCHMDNNKTIVSDKKKQNFSEFQKKFECIPKIKKDLYLKTELEILNGQVSLENSKLNEENFLN